MLIHFWSFYAFKDRTIVKMSKRSHVSSKIIYNLLVNVPAKGLNREWTACTRCGNTNVVTPWLYQTRGTKLSDNHERPTEFVHLSNPTAYAHCACFVYHYHIFRMVSNFLDNWPCAISTIFAPLFLCNLYFRCNFF